MSQARSAPSRDGEAKAREKRRGKDICFHERRDQFQSYQFLVQRVLSRTEDNPQVPAAVIPGLPASPPMKPAPPVTSDVGMCPLSLVARCLQMALLELVGGGVDALGIALCQARAGEPVDRISSTCSRERPRLPPPRAGRSASCRSPAARLRSRT